MKTPLILAVMTLVPIWNAPAGAGDRTSATVSASCCDPPARWAPRYDHDEARFAINSVSGETTMLLTDEVVAIQLSDRAFRKVRNKLREERKEDEDHPLGKAIKAAVLSSVRALLDHSAECPIRELSDVEYRKGRLIFTTEDGERIFEDIEVSDQDVMRGFSERDSRAFVREFRRLKARIG